MKTLIPKRPKLLSPSADVTSGSLTKSAKRKPDSVGDNLDTDKTVNRNSLSGLSLKAPKSIKKTLSSNPLLPPASPGDSRIDGRLSSLQALINSDPSSLESYTYASLHGEPYFFVLLDQSEGKSRVRDAGTFLSTHEGMRMAALNQHRPNIEMPRGEMFSIIFFHNRPELYSFGTLQSLKANAALYGLTLDMTSYLYGKDEDIYEQQNFAESCTSIAFNFGIANKAHTEFAAFIADRMTATQARAGFSIAMTHAVEIGRFDIVQFCLERGGVPMIAPRRDLEDDDQTAIELALKYDDTPMVELMLSRIFEKKDLQILESLFCEERGWNTCPEVILDHIARRPL